MTEDGQDRDEDTQQDGAEAPKPAAQDVPQERIFHPREEIELFSYLLRPTSRLGLMARHWILAPVMGGGCINLLCRGPAVTEEVRAFAYDMNDRIPFAHLYFSNTISRFSLEQVLNQRHTAIIDRFEHASIGNVDDIIHARRSGPVEAGVVCITEVDEAFTTEDIYDDNRFSEMAVSGFLLFVIDESLLTGLEEPIITDEGDKVFAHFLRRFGNR